MIAKGYQDAHQVLPESLRQKSQVPSERKPLRTTFLEGGKWHSITCIYYELHPG
jgi:hypothetical protein